MSKAMQRLDERLAAATPGTIRHEALETAKRFKSSWIELGRVLWTVWKEKAFRGWGYLTFEAYCAKELGIRSATAKKLLHSYHFLEREESGMLAQWSGQRPAALPHYESVNALRLLKQRTSVPEATYHALRTKVLEQGREPTEVRREIRTALEAAQPDPESARAARRQGAIRRMIGTLKSMHREFEAAHLVPEKLLGEIETLTKKLEQAL